MKKVKSSILIIMSLLLITFPVNAAQPATDIWPEGPKVKAKSAILMEASTGLILYEKNSNVKNYPASTTKLLTSLLALENSSLNEVVTFSKDSVFNIERGSSHIGIDVDEKLTMEQCLYGILLASANEVSYAVAEHIAGDVDSFSELMNERAKELGAKNTHFINPHGLFDESHYSSAYDLALISRELLKYEDFRKITSTINYVIPPTNIQEESRPLSNHHKMVRNTSIHYDGIIGGKTGYTQKARYSLATFASRNDMDLIVILMNEETSADQYTDTKNLLDFGFNNYATFSISDNKNVQTLDTSPFFTQYSSLLCKESSPLTVSGDGKVVLPRSADLSKTTKTVNYTGDGNIKDGINVIGNVSYYYDNKVVGSTDIIYNKEETSTLAKASFIVDDGLSIKDTIENSKKEFLIGIIVLLFITIGIIHYIYVERSRRKRRKTYYAKRKQTSETFHHDFTDL